MQMATSVLAVVNVCLYSPWSDFVPGWASRQVPVNQVLYCTCFDYHYLCLPYSCQVHCYAFRKTGSSFQNRVFNLLVQCVQRLQPHGVFAFCEGLCIADQTGQIFLCLKAIICIYLFGVRKPAHNQLSDGWTAKHFLYTYIKVELKSGSAAALPQTNFTHGKISPNTRVSSTRQKTKTYLCGKDEGWGSSEESLFCILA